MSFEMLCCTVCYRSCYEQFRPNVSQSELGVGRRARYDLRSDP